MSEEKDIKDFGKKIDILKSAEIERGFMPAQNAMREIGERSSLYIELMAAAFIQETGLKASECELIYWIDPIRNLAHFKFQKVEK